MTDIIYGNINIETKERMRKLLRPQVLTAIATVASAVAAFISLYVALRLEDATYHSQLYVKQVDSLSIFFGKASVVMQKLHAMRDVMLSENFSEDQAPATFSYDSRTDVSTELTGLDSASTALRLVFPEKFGAYAQELVDKGYHALNSETRLVHVAAIEHNWNTQQYTINPNIDNINRLIKSMSEKLYACAYQDLKLGKDLSDAAVKTCF